MSLKHNVISAFKKHFGGEPAHLIRAPGRVNLIGEHTDYNDGFVMPLAIDRNTWIALRPRQDRTVVLHSLNHNQTVSFDLDHSAKDKGWQEYPKGVAWALLENGHSLRGWEGVTGCDVPLGAGLSSSASFELAVARAFAEVSGFTWDAPLMALLSQKAENQWVGVNCGIMDQLISAVGKKDHAVLLDCRSLEATPLPLPRETSVVILDTATRRGLVESAYNERRRQCEEASAFFGVTKLRDLALDRFLSKAGQLDDLTRQRARHVLTENARTLQAAEAMRHHDAAKLGALMNASHDSLRDDFEVTNHELNVMVDLSRQAPGCIGARMTGAGFGGCAVALVREALVENFLAAVTRDYRAATGREPAVYACKASAGASTENMQNDE